MQRSPIGNGKIIGMKSRPTAITTIGYPGPENSGVTAETAEKSPMRSDHGFH
jgi:hypothetical protein